jgi:integrase
MPADVVDLDQLVLADTSTEAVAKDSPRKAPRLRPRTPGLQRFRNPALQEWTFVKPERPTSWPQTEWTRAEVLAALDELPIVATYRGSRAHRLRGVQVVLDWLEEQPGESWQDRWRASGADGAGRGWYAPIIDRLPSTTSLERRRWLVTGGLGPLIVLQVLRPSYAWLFAQNIGAVLAQVRAERDPGGFARLTAHCLATGRTCGRDQAIAFAQLTRMLIRNGGTPADITVEDCLEADHAVRQAREARGASLYYDLLLECGYLPAGSPPSLRAAKRRPLTVEELVDGYELECRPIRDLIVAYLRERQGAIDYSTVKGLAHTLACTFWRDLELHHPGIDCLQLGPEIAAAWKDRVRHTRRGREASRERRDPIGVMVAVRSFYSDIAHWALDDPARWAAFAAPNPIRPADTAAYSKVRHREKARMRQRTRERAPALPRLVETVEHRKHAAHRRLDAALAVEHSQSFTVDGEVLVRHVAATQNKRGAAQGSGRVYVIDPTTGKRRDLSYEEDDAFWAWAFVEVLRHTGIRIEEAVELTHHSFTAYRLPSTGELVPLLQIAPSKTDRERLLVVSPELAEVLTAIIFRVRGGKAALPLTPRYDWRERLTSAPMPYLFQRRIGPYHRVIPDRHVQALLERAVEQAGIVDQSGQPLRYTPHDFRRIFATEAIAMGLPLPILAKLMGHENIAVTEGYAAIYPEDVFRHHRAFISRRRSLRPSAEYRQPTDAEWEEFLAHFERRKVGLGICGRAYGTACQHEHACLRCPVLRPDPKQMPRLIEIIENLHARLEEATQQGWFGEIEGIQVSLTGAQQKLEQMRRIQASPDHQKVLLGLPTLKVE